MTTYVQPYTVNVSSTATGVALCTYKDATGQQVPAGTPLTTKTKAGEEGSLAIRFTETVVSGVKLRLVGATVKTVGHDPTLFSYNNLYATRQQTGTGGYLDTVVVPWAPDAYTTRGVVLLFAQVDSNGDMINFVPSTDPEVQNGPDT